MKTLVIHPEDSSTDFLKPIYEGLDNCEVITKGKTPTYIKNAIKKADRLIFLGHGTASGLIAMGQFPEENLYVIDERHAELIRQKNNLIFIWCYANEFLNTHNIEGFATGMFISEPSEAWSYLGLSDKDREIDISNEFFVKIIAENVDENVAILYQKVEEQYALLAKENRIAYFNILRIREYKPNGIVH